jgi:hypothetical protein
VALSAQRGVSRRAVLNSLIQALKWNSSVTGGEDPEDCNRRLRSLTRLASLLTLVVRASGSLAATPSSSAVQTQLNVSVDIVNYFITSDLPAILSTALSSVPLGHILAGEVVNAIFDPLEMMTRYVCLSSYLFIYTLIYLFVCHSIYFLTHPNQTAILTQAKVIS